MNVSVLSRALFDYDPSRDRCSSSISARALAFSFGDILHVVLPPSATQSTSSVDDASTPTHDWWQARRVLPWSDLDNSAGLIPSKSRYEILSIMSCG